MPIQTIIENPASRRITVDVPWEIPVGPIVLTFAPASSDQRSVDQRSVKEKIEKPMSVFDQAAIALGYENDLDYLRANSPKTIEEAEAEAERKFNDPNRKPFSRHYGAVQGVYGDGMEYQRKMRSEWPD